MIKRFVDNNALRGRHNGCDSVSNHQPHDCLLNRLFRRRSKKTSKLRVTGLCAENSPGTGEFPTQMASYAENVSIWWRHLLVIIQNNVAYPRQRVLYKLVVKTWWRHQMETFPRYMTYVGNSSVISDFPTQRPDVGTNPTWNWNICDRK